MPEYVLLMKLTEQGARDIGNAPQRIEEGVNAFQSLGGTIKTFLVTMGEYDYVAVGEAPSDEVALLFALQLAQRGNVKTTTMKAFGREDLARLVAEWPVGVAGVHPGGPA